MSQAAYYNGYEDGRADGEKAGARQAKDAMKKLLAGSTYKGSAASIDETRSAVSTLWRALGGTVASALAAMALALPAAEPPPGCAPVGSLVNECVVTNFDQAASAPVCPVVSTNLLPWSRGPVYVTVETNQVLAVASPQKWPVGAPVFVVVYPEAAGDYLEPTRFVLVGGVSLPHSPWQGVVWRMSDGAGDKFYANVLAGVE